MSCSVVSFLPFVVECFQYFEVFLKVYCDITSQLGWSACLVGGLDWHETDGVMFCL